MYMAVHVKWPLLLSDFNETLSTDFEKYSNIKFHKCSSSGAELFIVGSKTDCHDETNISFLEVYKRTF